MAASAEPNVLKFATVAPDGSPWARNFRGFVHQVEQATEGHTRIKFYFGGVAGDEPEQAERLRQGQLDGIIAAISCDQFSPSMALVRLAGLFQTQDEALAVMNRLQPDFSAEGHKSGFLILGTSGIGPDMFWTRTPVHSMAELRRLRLWMWENDRVGIETARAMGLRAVPLPLPDAARAFDRKEIDGFIAAPAPALAYQWYTQARYAVDLRPFYIWGCAVIRESAFLKLPVEQQNAIRDAIAGVFERNEEVSRHSNELLLGGAFQKQGVQIVPISPIFRAEFFAAAKAARAKLADKFISREMLSRALGMLADYRAEHQAGQP
jgi:TRAP-type C4-dicarboxylate transport system substrate-binding protein